MTNEKNFPALPFIPKTETRVILEQEQQQKLKLSPAARQKVVQKYGGNYQSERLNEINPGYGPGIVSITSGNSNRGNNGFYWCDGIGFCELPSLINNRICAATSCSIRIPSSEYYCSIHKFMVGSKATEVAKSFDETASRKGGVAIVNYCIPCQNKYSLEKKSWQNTNQANNKCNHCKKAFQLGEENWVLTNKETQQVLNTCLPCQNKHSFVKKQWG